ncbi:MBL fold metallo-hydrolase [Microbacterium terrisoli]|uniref:MBL fold metallo-hydrolase n=1 Tax=Microbacterium terrisoli TaxID=3242192 RepID=UPI0028055A15|nr:MBL fold metallo-hydrolase [Microbacterium protaetiae]
MRVTKHEHAALVIEIDGEKLIVDPGGFTRPIEDLEHVVGVVVTHEHADHWTPESLARIAQGTGGAPVYAPAGAAASIREAGLEVTVVAPGDTVELAPFTLEFFGGRHAVIHESLPVVDNVGVLVNDRFYYPGDSYAVPEGRDVELLAAPVGAPWLKIGEAMDFVLAVAPHGAFGTHDMTLSSTGLAMHRDRLEWATAQGGGRFFRLDPGDSTEL